jgi:hypothetical protein
LREEYKKNFKNVKDIKNKLQNSKNNLFFNGSVILDALGLSMEDIKK